MEISVPKIIACIICDNKRVIFLAPSSHGYTIFPSTLHVGTLKASYSMSSTHALYLHQLVTPHGFNSNSATLWFYDRQPATIIFRPAPATAFIWSAPATIIVRLAPATVSMILLIGSRHDHTLTWPAPATVTTLLLIGSRHDHPSTGTRNGLNAYFDRLPPRPYFDRHPQRSQIFWSALRHDQNCPQDRQPATVTYKTIPPLAPQFSNFSNFTTFQLHFLIFLFSTKWNFESFSTSRP